MPQYSTLIINRVIRVCKKTGKPNKLRKQKKITEKTEQSKKID
jgi:hypothetical protein